MTTKRDRLFNRSQGFASKTVKVGEDVFEVRQPSVGKRAAILRAAGMADGESIKDLGKMQVQAVIQCTFDPDDDKPVFTKADEGALLAMPAGGWLDDLSTTAIELMNVQPEEDAKDLSETESVNSSS